MSAHAEIQSHPTRLGDLDGKVAVVTGGASGIGLGLVRALLAQGAHVVAADVEQSALERTAAELRADLPAAQVNRFHSYAVDVSDAAAVDAFAAAVFERHGGCHFLANNAGVSNSGGWEPWETDPNDWQWTFGVNVFGIAHGVNAFVPRMLASGEAGWVVNTSSADGGLASAPGIVAYSASKAAAAALTESLAVRLAETGAAVGASLFIPSGGVMRSGMFEAERNRPAHLARSASTRAATPAVKSYDDLEALIEQKGGTVHRVDLVELGHFVITEAQQGRYLIVTERDDVAALLHERADHAAAGTFGPTLARGLAARRAGA